MFEKNIFSKGMYEENKGLLTYKEINQESDSLDKKPLKP